MKMHWRVQPMPKGTYRSFQFRGWPTLEYSDGRVAACITCEVGYSKHVAESGDHPPLRVLLYDYSLGIQHRKCLLVKRSFDSLSQAKEAAVQMLEKYSHFKGSECVEKLI